MKKYDFEDDSIERRLNGVEEERINEVIEKMPLKLLLEILDKYKKDMRLSSLDLFNPHLKWEKIDNDDLPYIIIRSNLGNEFTMNALSVSYKNSDLISCTPRPISRDWIMFTGKEIGKTAYDWKEYIQNYYKREALEETEND